jgi:hypothetical protein
MATLEEYLKGKKPVFSPEPWYNQDGDCLVVKFRDTADYSSRVDGVLTVFKDVETDEVVGFLIKGIKHLVESGAHFIRKCHNPPLNYYILACHLISNQDETAVPERDDLYYDILRKAADSIAPQIEFEELAY